MRTLFVTLGLGLAVALAGCGPEEEEFCPDGIVTDTPVPGLEKVGDNGWTAVLNATVPEPPTNGVNRWEIEIRDDLDDLRVDVNVSLQPVFTEDDFSPDPFPATVEGDLHIVPELEVNRPGVWDFEVNIEDDQQQLIDRPVFRFCLDGQ